MRDERRRGKQRSRGIDSRVFVHVCGVENKLNILNAMCYMQNAEQRRSIITTIIIIIKEKKKHC